MPIAIHKTENELTVDLEGAVTVRNAREVAAQLREALHGAACVTIGTSRLLDIDTSILQLLGALRKTVSLLRFENPSVVFIAAVDRCGLRRELLGGAREML